MQRVMLCLFITVIIFTLSSGVQAQTFYNQDFEEGTAGPGKPLGWTSSGQDYGAKTTDYYVNDTNPYEGSQCALMETYGTPGDPNDLSIASMSSDNYVSLLKDHTYAVSAAVRRSNSQWVRFIFFSAGFSIIHTECIDALDDGLVDSGWEIMVLHFRPPSNVNAFIRIDSIVTNARTASAQVCRMWVDDIRITDLGVETYQSIYNVTPPPPQYGIRNRYFDIGTDTEISTLGGTAYSCTALPKRWNIAMAVDTGTNHAPDYPKWGQEVPALTGATGDAGYVIAKAADTSVPAWPAMAADGIRVDQATNHGQRHALTFNYGAAGTTKPLLRVFIINDDFSHYVSLFVDPSIGIPGNRMWPMSLHYTPDYYDEFLKIRFDNVTIGAAGSGVHTDETTAYIDNVDVGLVDPGLDVTAPGTPAGLYANAGDGLVSLRWNPNEETDLAGYNVYQSETSSGPYTIVNGALVLKSADRYFADDTVVNDTPYYYVITAVDGTGNESGYSGEVMGLPTINMIHIPAGNFVMGDTFTDMDFWDLRNSRPTRTVYLSGYWIGRYELTNAEYASVLNYANGQGYLENSDGSPYTAGHVYFNGVKFLNLAYPGSRIDYNGSSFTVDSVAQETHPVVEVTWFGCALYCNWLSEQELKTPCYNTSTWECDFSANGYRLPTSAEWEKASGHDPTKVTYEAKRRYPWGDTWDCTKCNLYECNLGGTREVGSFPAGQSYYGCHDMAGNVYEWCNDRSYQAYDDLPDPDINPTGPDTGLGRVVRSGGHFSEEGFGRSAYRGGVDPTSGTGSQGFRVARKD